MEHFDGIESYSVKHLPIVKAYAERLGLVELVNHLVPSQMERGNVKVECNLAK